MVDESDVMSPKEEPCVMKEDLLTAAIVSATAQENKTKISQQAALAEAVKTRNGIIALIEEGVSLVATYEDRGMPCAVRGVAINMNFDRIVFQTTAGPFQLDIASIKKLSRVQK